MAKAKPQPARAASGDPRLEYLSKNVPRNADPEPTPALLDDLRFFADNKHGGGRISFAALQRWVIDKHGVNVRFRGMNKLLAAAGREPWWRSTK